jgi:hypothetical protein
MLTVHDDADVPVLDPVSEEAFVLDPGAFDAELEVDAADDLRRRLEPNLLPRYLEQMISIPASVMSRQRGTATHTDQTVLSDVVVDVFWK